MSTLCEFSLRQMCPFAPLRKKSVQIVKSRALSRSPFILRSFLFLESKERGRTEERPTSTFRKRNNFFFSFLFCPAVRRRKSQRGTFEDRKEGSLFCPFAPGPNKRRGELCFLSLYFFLLPSLPPKVYCTERNERIITSPP